MNIDDLDNLEFISKEDKKVLKEFAIESHKFFLERINMTEAEYQKLCAPYIEECNSFTTVMEKCRKNSLPPCIQPSRIEKGIGGETIHRGFYCPSLILDIVVGGCKRGRIAKRKNAKTSYTYYFDDNDKLVYIKSPHNIEYISYAENKSLGISFFHKELETISECEYDQNDRITKYIKILCHHTKNEVVEYEKEIYSYYENQIVVEHSSLNNVFGIMTLNINKYVFTIEDSFLKNYVVEIFDTKDISNEPLESRTYPIKIKRKV